MYHPYFRGKSYELITVREMAPVLKQAGFCPIIEPVREELGGLKKALDAVVEQNGTAVVIINPHHGDLSGDGGALSQLLQEEFASPGIAAGVLLKQDMTTAEAIELLQVHANHAPVVIHAGFADPKGLAQALTTPLAAQRHFFFDQLCGKLYRKHFKGTQRVLIKDGFVRRRNRDYDLIEPFSDLHVIYETEEGMQGFGDFLIVGDDFSETGGPAYAVAIHLTFIDPAQDDVMKIYHFKSDRQDTPQDPAGKFAEALEKMIDILDQPGCKVLETEAVKEFRQLHEKGHFPGLGYVKKLSMKHHIETLADYLS